MLARKITGVSKALVAAAATAIFSFGAQAAPIFNAGLLTGFTDLTVAGSRYNVQFVDGTFASVFPGGAIFDEPTAAMAATALYLSFAPQAAGGVSIAPYDIFGCHDAPNRTGVDACELMTPDTMVLAGGDVDVVSMRHGNQAIGGNVQDGNSAFGFSRTTDTTGFYTIASAYTWAVWTPAGGKVPEPATAALAVLALGLTLVGKSRRHLS